MVPQNMQAAQIYCDYLYHCQNAAFKSKQIYTKAFQLEQRIDMMIKDKSWQCPYRYLFSEDTIVIRASASKENFGKIMEASQNV